ncbi:MAG: 30S ribosomal protein S8 [Deltaproteobacteria bacterium]|nr:30S ribosomal protein S8 [Deltaproteobacteria bacterium]
MSMSDPIADMLTRIRNALMVKYSRVDIPASQTKINIAKVLKSEGYIKNYKIIKDNRQGLLRIHLRYDDEAAPVITGLQRVSRPGRRVYSRAKDLPQVLNGLGVNIISTSQGLMTDRQARQENLGGEVLCSIW